MLLDPSPNSLPFLVERAPQNSTTTNLVLSSIINSSRGRPINDGPLLPIPSTSQSSNTLSTTGSQPTPTNDILASSQFLMSQIFTTSSLTTLPSNIYLSKAGNGYLQQTFTPSLTTGNIGSQPSSSLSSSSIANSGSTGSSTGSSSSTPLWSSLSPSSDSSSSGSTFLISTRTPSPLSPTPSPLSSTPTMTSYVFSSSTESAFSPFSTMPPIPLPSTSLSLSFSTMTISTSAVVSTSPSTNSSLSADPSSSDTAFPFSSSAVSISGSTITPSPTTLIISTTEVAQYSTTWAAPWTSTLILTSVLSDRPTTAWTTSTSGVLSTAVVDTTGNRFSRSPGSIAGFILGVLGALAFAVLWLFCARRRQRKLSRDASAIRRWAPGGPLEAEVDMEERYAGIIAALNMGLGAGRNAQIEGSTSGEVSGELAIPHTSSPTLPPYSFSGVVLPQSGSEPRFEPEPFRTGRIRFSQDSEPNLSRGSGFGLVVNRFEPVRTSFL